MSVVSVLPAKCQDVIRQKSKLLKQPVEPACAEGETQPCACSSW